MTQSGPPATRLAELDALRGIAAMVVVLFHYTVQAPNVVPGIKTMAWGVPWGFYGVHLFFAISGFVIFMTLERTRTSADFAFSRFTRLFPAYWTAIFVTSGAVWLLGLPELLQPAKVIAINLTMLQGFVYVPAVDGAYWSLTVELAFYGCMWALWRGGLLARIEAVLIPWIALRLVWWLAPSAPWMVGNLLLVNYIAFFAIGIAAYRVRQGARRWIDQLPLLATGLAVTASVEGIEVGAVYLGTLAIFAALIAGRTGFLNAPVLVWLGALSYPLYLVHQNLGYAVITALETVGLPAWTATVLAILAALGAAQLVHDLVETPSLRMLRGMWKGRRERLAAAAP
jgi:peptidoglycan/LPS O-acetylase OafA/YrhL